MRWMIAGLLIALPASAHGLCDSVDPYDCLAAYFGDVHNHPGNTATWVTMDDPAHDPELGCAHSYKLTSTMCSEARANGADWINISHHPRQLSSGTSSGWDWFTATNTVFTEPHPGGGSGDDIARNTFGFLLADGSTFSARELEWSCDQAMAESTPGTFLCMCGIEYTVGGVGTGGCPSPGVGAPKCGGHKIAVCPGIPTTNCASRLQNEALQADLCSNEGDLYGFADVNDCAVFMAHPCGSTSPSDFTQFDGSRPGGLHPHSATPTTASLASSSGSSSRTPKRIQSGC